MAAHPPPRHLVGARVLACTLVVVLCATLFNVGPDGQSLPPSLARSAGIPGAADGRGLTSPPAIDLRLSPAQPRVSLLDGDPASKVAGPTASTAGTPLVVSVRVGAYPDNGVYDAGNGAVYVGSEGTWEVTELRGLADIGTVFTWIGPYCFAYDPTNGYVYAVNQGGDNVTVLSGTTIVGSVPVGGLPLTPTFDSRNGFMYVPNDFSGNVSVINGTLGFASIRVGTEPVAATYDSRLGLMYISNRASSSVTVLNGTSILGNVSVGTGPSFSTYDPSNGYLYVPNRGSGTVSVIQKTSVVATVNIGLGTAPQFATFDSANGYVYVVDTNASIVTVLNGTQVIGSVVVGYQPSAAVFDSRDGLVLTGNRMSGTVSILNGTLLVATVNVGTDPVTPVYDARNGAIYVPNSLSSNVSVLFPDIPSYPVRFSESGLPHGTPWAVTLNATSETSATSAISFLEPNGTVAYSVQPPLGFRANRSTGAVTVAGDLNTVAVAFTPSTHWINFTESGLPAGLTWAVNLSGTRHTSTTPVVSFAEANGSYPYLVGLSYPFTPTPRNGTVIVNGKDELVPVTFARLYAVTFTETGLPDPPMWSVGLYGLGIDVRTPPGAFLYTFELVNGSYRYSIASVPGWTCSDNAGLLAVAGSPVSLSFVWLRAFNVTFAEVGLPPGSAWNVTIANETRGGYGNLPFVGLANGTYAFQVGDAASYSANPAEGTVVVHGANVVRSIAFTPRGSVSPTPWYSALYSPQGSILLVGLGIVVMAGILTGVLRRRERRGREPPMAEPIAPEPPAETQAGYPK